MMNQMRHQALKAAKPPPRMRLSKWIEKEIRLPETVSALPGRVSLYEYQKEIADAISDPAIERVTLVKPVRVGFTTLLTSAIASFIANDPAPILAVLPTDDDCRDYLVSDIEPIFAASPALAGLLAGDSAEGARDTMLSRRFPGGSLKIVASKSPRNLRRHNVRVLFIDEADAMPPGAEGSPILLAEKRTLSFPDRKIVMGSTPVDAVTSNVLRSYEQSDKRIFEVPCPECGTHNVIMWKDIQWPEGKPSEAYYCAPCCGSVIDEKHKLGMLAAGRWRATAPEVKGHAGFQINALISPLENVAWGKLAAEFLQAKKDPEDLRTFINTILAEGTGDGGEELDEVTLFDSRQPFGLEAIPESVLAITAGCDVQHDRIEITFIGWDRHGVAHVLGHSVIWGRWDDGGTWTELDELMRTRWRHPFGGTIGVDAACIDAGDGTTMDAVYEFAFPRARRRIMAIKGVGGSRPAITASKQKKGTLWIVGVDGLKTALFDRLKTGQHFNFSNDLDLDWFEQLTGERMTVRYKKGVPIREFVPVSGRRHEALDCVVYATAAYKVLNLNWDRRESELKSEPQVPARPRIVKSEWATGQRN
ncbi:phage terminase large subunit family protein [Hoeflea sp. Naph1]|uniref:phage terminase large subunit family protein n=1 Tax=Hoeflea sp. Naph1 TaxID=3388653 RepID=UPI00398FA14B